MQIKATTMKSTIENIFVDKKSTTTREIIHALMHILKSKVNSER